MMDRYTRFVTHHSKAIVAMTFALALVCAVMALTVSVNYDLTSYLPESCESTKALEVMDEEFTTEVPNARVMVTDVTLSEALEYKQRLAAADGVSGVMWLDDVADVSVPLASLDEALVSQYYQDGAALFTVTVGAGQEGVAIPAIYDVIGETGSASGQAVTDAETQSLASSEVAGAFGILVPLILLLLVLSTSSWVEPLFFLLAIGVSIVFNMGTNVFLGEVSYIAFTVSPILQLAVSLDYAIFLLHAFQRARLVEPDAHSAMRQAMKESSSSIAASAATTMFGFAALRFMQFGIGADLGITLVKGIVFSFLCVMVFLPAFTLLAYKLVDKTSHRPFMPSFRRVGRVMGPLRIPMLLLVCALIVPCVLAQSHTAFTYGMGSGSDSDTRTAHDAAAIEETFGASTPIMALVPRESVGAEAELSERLAAIPQVTQVLSYPAAVGAEVPVSFVGADVASQFYSEHYARVVVYADMPKEGAEAFSVVEQIRSIVGDIYGDEGLVAGEPANLYDMRDVTAVDSKVTNAIAIVAILLVLLATFRSLLLPVVLILTIESAIFINLAVPYFTGDSLNYLGFLVINTVQLGATVDYAILFTNTYLGNRRRMPAKEALFKTCGDTFKSILVSASILALAGCVLWLTSSISIISLLGLLLMRGTLLSLLMVITFLPGALLVLDKPIEKTTRNARFFKGGPAQESVGEGAYAR